MARYRKRPIPIEASQWFKNGDHPEDFTAERQFTEQGHLVTKPGSFFKDHDWEGGIVRYLRRPDVDGERPCTHCGVRMHDHGWIDTSEGGHIVCPGDWIITGVAGERYPVKDAIFRETYVRVSDAD